MQVGAAHIHLLRKFIGRELKIINVFFYDAYGAFQQLFVHGIESNLFRFHFQGFGVLLEHVAAGTHHVLYLGSEDGDGERLGDIIIRTYLQAFQLVFYVGFGRQDDNWNVAGTNILFDILT